MVGHGGSSRRPDLPFLRHGPADLVCFALFGTSTRNIMDFEISRELQIRERPCQASTQLPDKTWRIGHAYEAARFVRRTQEISNDDPAVRSGPAAEALMESGGVRLVRTSTPLAEAGARRAAKSQHIENI